jgi:hypothetical protein
MYGQLRLQGLGLGNDGIILVFSEGRDMGRELDALLAGVLALEDNEGEDKVMPLREA